MFSSSDKGLRRPWSYLLGQRDWSPSELPTIKESAWVSFRRKIDYNYDNGAQQIMVDMVCLEHGHGQNIFSLADSLLLATLLRFRKSCSRRLQTASKASLTLKLRPQDLSDRGLRWILVFTPLRIARHLLPRRDPLSDTSDGVYFALVL